MALSKIKKEFAGKRIGFNASFLPLASRSDIDDLAIIAHQSQDPSLLRLFETLPPLAVLKKARTESELKRPALGAGNKGS